MKNNKNNNIIGWLIFSFLVLLIYFIYPDAFSAKAIVDFIKKYDNYILPIYIFIFLLRSFTLIPNTPFVIAGTLLFPKSPFLVLFISVFCISLSSLIIYYFSELLGFDKFFKNKYPYKMEAIKKKLDNKYGLLFIITWAFLPFAPTDLVCYASGILKINIFVLLSGIILGELPICYFYIFSFKHLGF